MFFQTGKAGGSTIACNLRFGRKYIQNHCDNIDFDLIEDYDPKTATRPYIPESAISRSVNCYTHWRMQLKCMYLQGDHPFRGSLNSTFKGTFGSRHLSDHHHSSSSREREESRGRRKESSSSKPRKSKKPKQHRRPNDYLVNVRSPLDRIASWFVYEHTENHGSSKWKHCVLART